MIYLDESITADQRRLLESWRFNVQQIGVEIKHKGIEDHQIITFLQQLNGVTFITGDSDFFEKQYCHPNYAIIFLDIEQFEMAYFVRKILKHAEFDTQAKRLGMIIKLTQSMIHYWQFKSNSMVSVAY